MKIITVCGSMKFYSRNNLKYQLYENSSTNKATDKSKNIEIIIKKES